MTKRTHFLLALCIVKTIELPETIALKVSLRCASLSETQKVRALQEASRRHSMLGAYEGVDKWTLTRRISAGISSPENKQVRSGELSRMTLVVACRMSQFKAQIAYLGMSLLLLQRKGFLVVFHGPSLLVDRIGELLSSNVARSECPRRYIDVAVPADFRLDKHLLAVGVILTNADPSRQNHRDDLGQVIIVALPSFVSGQARPPIVTCEPAQQPIGLPRIGGSVTPVIGCPHQQHPGRKGSQVFPPKLVRRFGVESCCSCSDWNSRSGSRLISSWQHSVPLRARMSWRRIVKHVKVHFSPRAEEGVSGLSGSTCFTRYHLNRTQPTCQPSG